MRAFSIFIILCCNLAATANDSLTVSQVLHRIRSLQVKEAGDFPAGMFPSYREYHAKMDVFKNDDNIFFTGLVVYTLKDMKPYLSLQDQLIIDSICTAAAPLYSLYRNRQGRVSYNFWRTNPPVVFPNGSWLNLMNRSHALPDDMDDTSIILLAADADADTARAAHHLMQQHLNSGRKQKQRIHKDYRGIKAYSTWFGKRMPVDLDVCVLSNVLHMLQRKDITFSAADTASLQFICTAIDNRDIVQRPSYVSPHYARTPIILYHLARLMETGKLTALEERKAALVKMAREQLAAAANPLDRLILSTALLKWGEEAPVLTFTATSDLFTEFEQNDFVFFIANMASILPDPLRQGISKAGIGRFCYYAPAYNEVLLMEYLVQCRKRKQ